MKKVIVLVLCCYGVIALAAQSLSDSLTQQLSKIYEASSLSGFGVAVVNEEGILYEKGFGYANTATKSPYTIETVHNIGSVSKTFIAVAIMQLIEQGKLQLDTEINSILPFRLVHPRYPNKPITVEQLVTHTSGIRDHPKTYSLKCYVLEEDFASIKNELSGKPKLEARLIKNGQAQDLGTFLKAYFTPEGEFYKRKNFTKYPPAEKYVYSNIGSAVAAYVVEVITGQSYADYVKTNILQPLQMQYSGWTYADIDENKHAICYHPKGQAYPRYSLVTYPDGGVRTSVQDMSKYVQEMLKGYLGNSTFMEAKTFQTMFTEQYNEEDDPIAVFWDINGRGYIGHNGADPGIFTNIQFLPEEKIGLIFMTNCSIHDNKETLQSGIQLWPVLRTYGLKMQKSHE